MEPKVQEFNGRVFVIVPDHIEHIIVLRREVSHQFTLPREDRHYNQKIGSGLMD